MTSLASVEAVSLSNGELARSQAADVVADRAHSHARASLDGLSREVYCVLGVPIDVVGMPSVIQAIEAAAIGETPYLISTPNLNFLVTSRSNVEFRNSLLLSDLCTPDGMPIVWIARLLGLPIGQRIAGSDFFLALKARDCASLPLSVFLFGGAEGIAAAAAKALNTEAGRLTCAGYLNPGFGNVEELSRPEIISAINSSNADFLLVALGAANGQAWLARNHHLLRIPVRSHLGATINFQAGAVRRAPHVIRRLGLEWLWRIKEEPRLWRRYWHDGLVLLRLLATRVLPLAIYARWLRGKPADEPLRIESTASDTGVMLRLSGSASEQHVAAAMACFRSVLAGKPATVTIDMTATSYIDARFLGLLLILQREIVGQGASLSITGASPRIKLLFRLHEADFLLSE